ncbi:hypothetical protein R70006_06193 [Paraburkholderia domus]|nr:hypothetical protein R70006_06193 [Paraburkholderia domus]
MSDILEVLFFHQSSSDKRAALDSRKDNECMRSARVQVTDA